MSRLGVCRMLRDCDGGKHLFSEMMRVANGGVGSPGRRKYRCSGRSRHWMDAWSPGNGRTLVQERRANDVFIDCPMRCCFGNLVRPRGLEAVAQRLSRRVDLDQQPRDHGDSKWEEPYIHVAGSLSPGSRRNIAVAWQ